MMEENGISTLLFPDFHILSYLASSIHLNNNGIILIRHSSLEHAHLNIAI